MPIAAKFSKAFYERLGDQVVGELVEFVNLVDATYRSELREQNELNYARFEAKLEQRFAQLDAKIDRLAAELRGEMAAMRGEFRGEFATKAELAQLTQEMNRRFDAMYRFMLLQTVALLAAIIGVGLR